jgi:hypothetical protein
MINSLRTRIEPRVIPITYLYSKFISFHWIPVFVVFVGIIKPENLVHDERYMKQ